MRHARTAHRTLACRLPGGVWQPNTTSYTTSAGAGDHAADTAGSAFTGTFNFWTFLGDVDVMASGAPGTVIALGDSITDGVGSAQDANHRWPNYLATRLTT